MKASVDNTAKICNQWIKDNTLLINYIYTDEKGVSKARNIGLKNAKGKYVAFIDADDYIANTYLEVLYKNITKNDGNISICGYIVTNKREKCESEKDCENKIFGKIIDFNDICKHVFRDSSIGGYVWNKLFDKKILDNKYITVYVAAYNNCVRKKLLCHGFYITYLQSCLIKNNLENI